MCSIFGLLGESQENLYNSFEKLKHRGTDSANYTQTKNYFFGSHRLAIESFNLPQNQPLERGDYISLFNGEIYNYKELIDKFKLNANSEIEAILELFKLKRDDLIQYLRGMFAIAIYKISTNELWLFRDIAGKKPLYFALHNNTFIFASEPKAIYNQIGFSLDKRAIHQYLGFGGMPYINTLSKDVKKVPPSSILHFKNGNYTIKDIEFLLNQKIEFNTINSAATIVDKELKEAIKLRVPNLKYGVLLSGGLDSSLLASMLHNITNDKLNMFTIGYDGYENYDERKFAQQVSKHINANLHTYNFTKEDFFKTIDELLDNIDEPLGDPAQIPLYFLIKKAKESGVKVLLSGDGSDELFLGYRTYKEYYMMEKVKELPYSNWLKNHLKSNLSLNKEWEWYKRALNKETIFRSTAEIYTDRQLNALLRLQAKDNTNFEYIKSYYNNYEKSSRDIADWYSYCDIKVQLAEFFLTKIDRVSMLSGVEVRNPFLDKNVMQTAFSIDPNIRLDTANPKSILKKIATNYLPKEIITRKKKGLNYPFLEWILEEDGINVINEANKKFRLFHQKHLDYLSQKANQGKFRQHLFPLYILSRWLIR